MNIQVVDLPDQRKIAYKGEIPVSVPPYHGLRPAECLDVAYGHGFELRRRRDKLVTGLAEPIEVPRRDPIANRSIARPALRGARSPFTQGCGLDSPDQNTGEADTSGAECTHDAIVFDSGPYPIGVGTQICSDAMSRVVT